MDVVNNRIFASKLALPLLTAVLLLAAPRIALAQTLTPSSSTVALVGGEGQSVTVSSSDSTTAISYTVSVTYPSGQNAWLSVGGASPSGTTPSTLTLQYSATPCYNSCSPAATVTLTATAPSSVAGTTATIAVTWSSSSSGGGGGGGTTTSTITASSTSVTADTSVGTTTSTQVVLSSTSTSAIAFTLSSSSPASWLTVAANSSAVSSSASAVLSLSFNSTGLSSGAHTATFYVYYGSSQNVSISVTYTVIASSVVTISPTTASWGYSSGSTVPYTDVTLTTSATYFSAVSSASWILLTYPSAPSYFPSSSSVSNFATSLGLRVIYNTAASTPSTGTQGTVTITDSYGNSAIFTVTFTGSGTSTSGTVSLTPTSVALTCAVNTGSSCAQSTVAVTSTVGGTLTVSLTSPLSLYVTAAAASTSITAGNSISVYLYANATGLSSVSYSGTLTATVVSTGGSSYQATIPVSFAVGAASTTVSNAVAPTALTFAADVNHPAAISPQYITVAASGNYTATVTSGSQWLSVSSTSGTSGGLGSPALVGAIVSPSGLTAGNYTGTISIVSSAGTTTVSVALTVYSAAVIYVATDTTNAASINLVESGGYILGVVPVPYVYTSDSSVATIQASTTSTWLSVSPSYPPDTLSTPHAGFQLLFSASNLANGVYTGSITFTSPTAANSQITLPVILSVTGSTASTGVSLAQSSINMSASVGGSSTSTSVSVQASSSTSFTASSNSAWLTVNPSSGTAPTTITVTASPSGLSSGTYYGTVTVSGGGATATASVTFTVGSSSSSGGNVSSSPSSLTFNYTVNGSTPASQNLTISNSVSGTASISFSVGASVNGGSVNWLAAAVNGGMSGTTQATVVVSVSNLSSLSAGSYTGNVTITPSGGNVLSIPVTLVVAGAPTVAASPSSLTFSYQVGGSTPTTQPLQVSGSVSGLTYSASVSTVSGGNWLVLSKTSGTTPDVLSVSVSPSSLSAGTAYQGTILVQGTGTATGSSSTISVVLTVTAPFPTISSALNAASFVSGAISPGELVSLFGTAMGPTTALGTKLDSTGKVATTLGNVQVLFNGYAAPLTYVSDKQINCVVPYEVAQLSSPYVQVKYLGQTSNTYNLKSAATAPGIFTISGGTGQGAILNSDNSYNSSSKPAAAGSTVQLFVTGEGQLSPAGVTGSVTCSAGCTTVNQIPLPLLAVAALVNNQPATITFAREAPGDVSGVLQVNVTIPPNTPSGSIPIVITVGSNSTQSGVTVSVQ